MSNTEILEKLEKLEKLVLALSQKIDNLDRSCSRMDDHIDFVERTYDVLRSPLSLLTNISSRFYSSVEDDNLPQLENRNV
jgi:hypothetical protein